ncbi:TPA: hypothetical protein DDW35_02665 [Candidatus Sumerlaeota bacterium]|jgi:beta-lactamase regulating signal transducer with metallopeptidase domain|nr:hypothetical protein [Candidatus Sumerlaeota bacterium]
MLNLLQSITTLPLPAVIFLKVTLLLVVAWSLHFAFARSNPRWRVLLWRTAMVGLFLLIPAQLFFPKLDIPVLPHVPAPSVSVQSAVAESTSDAWNAALRAVALSNRFAHKTDVEPWWKRLLAPETLCVIAWALISTLLLIRRTAAAYRLHCFLRTGQPAPDAVAAVVQNVSTRIELNESPALRMVNVTSSPFVSGIFRPTIVIPESLTGERYQEDLPAILAHELVHIKSFDIFWMQLSQWLSVFFWFHPLVWDMRRSHNMACEQVSDSVAAELSGGAPSYSQALARTFVDLVVDVQRPVEMPLLRPAEIMVRLARLRRGLSAQALRQSWVTVAVFIATLGLAVVGCVQLTSRSDGTSAQGKMLALNSDVVRFDQDEAECEITTCTLVMRLQKDSQDVWVDLDVAFDIRKGNRTDSFRNVWDNEVADFSCTDDNGNALETKIDHSYGKNNLVWYFVDKTARRHRSLVHFRILNVLKQENGRTVLDVGWAGMYRSPVRRFEVNVIFPEGMNPNVVRVLPTEYAYTKQKIGKLWVVHQEQIPLKIAPYRLEFTAPAVGDKVI